MSAVDFLADLIFGLGRRAARFSRKRAPGDEEHFYPKFPEMLTPPLRPGQCFHCGKRFAEPYPLRGCAGVKK